MVLIRERRSASAYRVGGVLSRCLEVFRPWTQVSERTCFASFKDEVDGVRSVRNRLTLMPSELFFVANRCRLPRRTDCRPLGRETGIAPYPKLEARDRCAEGKQSETTAATSVRRTVPRLRAVE